MAEKPARRATKPAAKKPAKTPRKSAPDKSKKPVLLAGGNPQIAKCYGDAPVQAFIAAAPGWKAEIARRIDETIEAVAPGVCKAVKWNSPFYGVEEGSWFLSFHYTTKYVKVAFFRGASLRPVPPVASKVADVRYLHIHEDDAFDAAQFAKWVKQALRLPGVRM